MNSIYMDFSRSYLDHLGLLVRDTTFPLSPEAVNDKGLRSTIFGKYDDEIFSKTFPEIDPGKYDLSDCIFAVRDIFSVEYVVFPVKEGAIVIGPFLTQIPDTMTIMQIMSALAIPGGFTNYFQQFYTTVPCLLDSSMIYSFITVLQKSMNGTRESRIVTLEKIPEGKLEYVNADSSPDENLYHSLEQRYEKESEGMDCIARGDVEGAEKIFVSPMFTRMEHRSSDALRSEKNFMIVANTIYRKAAEAGKVHPIYLDRLSRQYSQLIENISGVDEIAPMSKKMIRGYCMLVKTHSTSSYSPMIAHAMNFISLNISDEMNLSKVAEICNANKSYLSSQFKKETGMTITDFINSKKIDHAVFMINAQSGSFSEIAAACGISDITYFTRLFKKYKGMSPSEYRALVTG